MARIVICRQANAKTEAFVAIAFTILMYYCITVGNVLLVHQTQ